MEMGANNSWFPPILQYTNTSISVNLPPVNFLFYQVHLKEPCSSFSPSCQGEENQGRKEKARKRRQWLITELFAQVLFLSSQGAFGQKPHSKGPGNSLHYSEDPFRTPTKPQTYVHSVGRACHLIPPTTTAGGAQPSHGHVTGRDSAGWENSSIFPLQPRELKRNRVTKWGLKQIYLPPSGQLPSLWNGVATKRYHIQHAWDMSTK